MTRFALARMPMDKQPDEVLYDGTDGRYIDGRTDPFPGICIKALRESGYLDEVIHGSTVLDVGSGTGQLCNALSSIGDSHYLGVDPGKRAYDLSAPSKKTCYANCTASEIDERFDVVMSWHVLEHVMDPEGFIKVLFDRCKTGGLVIIATPNASSIFARSDKWRCMESFHVYLLGKKMLAGLVRENGGRVLSHTTWGGFPAPRGIGKEALNRLARLFGTGDVQLIIARKP